MFFFSRIILYWVQYLVQKFDLTPTSGNQFSILFSITSLIAFFRTHMGILVTRTASDGEKKKSAHACPCVSCGENMIKGGIGCIYKGAVQFLKQLRSRRVLFFDLRGR